MKTRLLPIALALIAAAGCQQQHPLADYRPLIKAGISTATIEQLKTLSSSDSEIAQFQKLKDANVSDQTCLALIAAAHTNQHPFNSADSVINLQGARYPDAEIISFARVNKLDSISGEAVMLRLIGLSNSATETILQRHLAGLPTLSTAQIGRLKNTGLTEKQILEKISAGMTDTQADKEAAARETARNHSNTDFVRVRGRKPH
jgi:hypothetical protein